MSRAWAGGSSTESRKQRAEILARDNYRCQLRIPGICLHKADQDHHRLGKGVSERLEDRVAACGPCNRRVGDPRANDPQPRVRRQW